jgi:MoaA/NifB/PqqE/SkfB family radical SAM enzyme
MQQGCRKLALPGYIQVEVSSRCNLACSACPHGVRSLVLEDRLMPRELFERLVETTIRPGQRYHLQGWGEPLLRKDLPDLARHIVARGGIPSLTTNGTLVTAETAERLMDAGLDFITISLAAGRPELQIESKPGAELGTILQAFRRLKKARKSRRLTRPLLAASFELSRRGLASFRTAVKVVKKAGAERIIAIHPILAVTAAQEADLLTGLPDEREMEHAAQDIRRAARKAMWRSISFYCEPLEPEIKPVCREDPLGSMYVGASGDISPCAFLGLPVGNAYSARHMGKEVRRARLSMGNLNQADAAEIWDSPKYRQFREAYLARKEEAEAKGPILRGEIEAPVPGPCLVCLRSQGY